MKNENAKNEKILKNGVTELVFILDRSGSMAGLESDTVGGFNSLITRRKEEGGDALVTTLLFDDKIETLHDRVPLSEIGKMTEKEYYVRGCTALLDAVGETLERISMIHKYARREDVPEKTIFVITTDGLENASRKFSTKQVKDLVKAKRELGWEFLFLGANIDAVETAGAYGIAPECAVDYHADRRGTKKIYEALDKAVGCFMKNSSVGKAWREEADEDYNSRK